jgi:hypothetical protein
MSVEDLLEALSTVAEACAFCDHRYTEGERYIARVGALGEVSICHPCIREVNAHVAREEEGKPKLICSSKRKKSKG